MYLKENIKTAQPPLVYLLKSGNDALTWILDCRIIKKRKSTEESILALAAKLNTVKAAIVGKISGRTEIPYQLFSIYSSGLKLQSANHFFSPMLYLFHRCKVWFLIAQIVTSEKWGGR